MARQFWCVAANYLHKVVLHRLQHAQKITLPDSLDTRIGLPIRIAFAHYLEVISRRSKYKISLDALLIELQRCRPATG